MRATLTEQNCMALKYLKWHKPLTSHPDFISAFKDAPKYRNVDALTQKHPCLSFLGVHEEINEETRLFLQGIYDKWGDISDMSEGRIDIVSKPFLDGLNMSFKSLFTDSIIDEIQGQRFSGTTFIPDGCGGHTCYIYDFVFDYKNSGGIGLGKETNYFIVLGRCDDVFMSAGRGADNKFYIYVSKEAVAEHLQQTGKKSVDTQDEFNQSCKDVALHSVMSMVAYHIFKRYANVEVKNARMLDKKDQDQPIVKTTITDVNYIDCSWFTTIVRSEGFKVRGHFRLQPYKNEEHEWDKKLIYISPFEKHGYTRRAKKLLDMPQENSKTI